MKGLVKGLAVTGALVGIIGLSSCNSSSNEYDAPMAKCNSEETVNLVKQITANEAREGWKKTVQFFKYTNKWIDPKVVTEMNQFTSNLEKYEKLQYIFQDDYNPKAKKYVCHATLQAQNPKTGKWIKVGKIVYTSQESVDGKVIGVSVTNVDFVDYLQDVLKSIEGKK